MDERLEEIVGHDRLPRIEPEGGTVEVEDAGAGAIRLEVHDHEDRPCAASIVTDPGEEMVVVDRLNQWRPIEHERRLVAADLVEAGDEGGETRAG
jgi:hypothetical protein